ncbi:MAG: lytic transglycosylase domain-containing protein [Candidatus Tectimicrobiota bacterium]
MDQRPIGVMALAAVALGLFATFLIPSGTDIASFAVTGSHEASPPRSSHSSGLLSWLHPVAETATMLRDDLQMPGDLVPEVAASIHRHTHATRIAPALVVALIKVESGGDPRAVSPKQAVGLMQIHYPVWGKILGVSYEKLFDIDTNIRAGIHILNHYLQRHETLIAALAAYGGNPRSRRYPTKVLATFHQLARES